MLSRLSIQNYAIIDELEINFPAHLNIITGETGAGKSILVGALDLVLGERADSSVLINKERKCIVEAIFPAGKQKDVRLFLQNSDLDVQEEITLRREIATNGKSRAFINDTPVTLQLLQELGMLLVDLHRQFDTLQVGESDFQRRVLDALAGQVKKLEEYQSVFSRMKSAQRELESLQTQQQQFEKESDFNRFQFSELDDANFKENELEDIDAELKMLSHAENIRSALDKINYALHESESPIVSQLKSLIHQLQPLSNFHSELPVLISRLQASQIELQDIAGDVDRLSNHIDHDPSRLDQLNERLSLGYRLQKKHGVQTTAALLEIKAGLEEKLRAVMNIGEAIENKEKEFSVLRSEVMQLANALSVARHSQVKSFETKVNGLLTQVGMPNARIRVEIKKIQPGPSGIDDIIFLFNANAAGGKEQKPETFQPVHKVASGGELSRLMLCIKSLVAKSIDLPTMIFDEIDTGISGEAARQVGIIMKELAAKRQLICITHQPQIAGKADTHFFVYKEIAGNTIKTGIRQLSVDERITAIAKMLSGEKPTAAAIENAREMVRN